MPITLLRYSVTFLLKWRVHENKNHVCLVHQFVPRSHVRHMTNIQTLVEAIHPLVLHLCGLPGKSSWKSLWLESTESGSKSHFKASQMGSLLKCHSKAFSLFPSPVCVPSSHQASHACLESAEELKRWHCFAFSKFQAETTQPCVKGCLREPIQPGF